MINRTPTTQRLEFLIRRLEDAVKYVRSHVQYNNLTENAIIAVMKFLGQNHSKRQRSMEQRGYVLYEPSIYGLKSDVVYHDIGYRLIKDQLEKESDLSDQEKRLLFDGVMGWLWYTPGTAHDTVMNQMLKNYVASYRIQRLNENFAKIRNGFNRFGSIAKKAERRLLKEYVDRRETAYGPMFTQLFSHPRKSYMDVRQDQIARLIPGFKPTIS